MLVSCNARPSESATRCAASLGIAEDMDREMADRARDAGAIEVERRQVGGADVLARIHLHAVDDREEILAAQADSAAPARAARGRRDGAAARHRAPRSRRARRRAPRACARPAGRRRRCRRPRGTRRRPRTCRRGGRAAAAASPSRTRFRPPRPGCGWSGAAPRRRARRRRRRTPRRSPPDPSRNAAQKGREEIGFAEPDPGGQRVAAAQAAQQARRQLGDDRAFAAQSRRRDTRRAARAPRRPAPRCGRAGYRAPGAAPGSIAAAVSASTPIPAAARSVERQIDAVEPAVILGAILQMVEHLQAPSTARPRRARCRGSRRADRAAAGRPARPNSGNTPSARPSRGSAAWSASWRKARKTSWQCCARHAGRGEALAHRRGGRRIVARRAVEHRRHAVEPAELVRRRQVRVVGDVVGVAGKAVEGVHMRPQIAPDQQRPDREILAAAPFARGRLDDLAVLRPRAAAAAIISDTRWPQTSSTASAMASRAGRGR